MRTSTWVVLACIGCGKSEDHTKQLDAVRNAPAAERPAKYCELVKDVKHEQVRDFVTSRILELADVDAAPDAPIDPEIECLLQPIMATNNPPDLGPEIAELHFKRPSAAAPKAMFAAMPADKKTAILLETFAKLARVDEWSKSVTVAAPAMIAELDKAGAAGDSKFFLGLVSAYALVGDTVPAVKARYAKVATDPRVATAWVDWVQKIGNRDNMKLEVYKPYAPTAKNAVPEIVASKATFNSYTATGLVKLCGEPGADCTAATGFSAETKEALRSSFQTNNLYDFATRARGFIAGLDGAGGDGELKAVFAELEGLVQSYNHADRKVWDDGMNVRAIDQDDKRVPKRDEFVAQLVALGPSVTPQLLELVQRGSVRARIAARALAKSAPAALVKFATEALASQLEHARTIGRPIENPGMEHALVALADSKGDGVDTVFLHALSSPDARISGFAVAAIKTRMQRDAAVDALFKFMAAKKEYAQYEIDVYVDLVEKYGKEATGPVVKALEQMLAAAGAPQKVFWAHKVVAMTALQKIGTTAAAPIVRKYATDPDSFQTFQVAIEDNDDVLKTPKVESKPEDRKNAKTVPFKQLAADTLAKLK